MTRPTLILLFLLIISCQGPWSYYPENPETYQGIWVYAYVTSGRPVEKACLDKLHSLSEVRMHGFAFYEFADIKMTGSFNGRDTSFFLEPDTANYAHNPNCFVGPKDLIADTFGGNYELEAAITWDSAGTRTVTRFSAKTYIPKKFKVLRGYNLLGQRFGPGDTILYLPPPMDLKSNYFIPEYSDDVGGVLVSIVYVKDISWGENTFDKIREQFVDGNDTAEHARFDDRRILYTATNRQIGNMNKDIDSIPILGIGMPAIGNIKLLFYAATPDYFKFEDTFLNNRNDSRIEPVYNIQGAAGIFTGMHVDTFEVNLKTADTVKVYPYSAAQDAYCSQIDAETYTPYWKLHRECVEFWDKRIWDEIVCGHNPVQSECRASNHPQWHGNYPQWYEIPSENLKNILSMEELTTWCEHRYFPIDRYQLCGSAMVYYSKNGKSSPILDREVKKYCEAHRYDAECIQS